MTRRTLRVLRPGGETTIETIDEDSDFDSSNNKTAKKSNSARRSVNFHGNEGYTQRQQPYHNTLSIIDDDESIANQTNTSTTSAAMHSLLSTRLESALAHLQPLRDLALNWDVDIAACLEEVLHELAAEAQMANTSCATNDSFFYEQTQTQDLDMSQNRQSMMSSTAAVAAKNEQTAAHFSQAALLLQNAGFVYGRKVEYLHNLVYQAMKDLSQQQAQAQKGASATKSGRKSSSRQRAKESLEDFENFDPDCLFYLMDRVIPIAPRKGQSNAYRPSIDLECVAEDEAKSGGGSRRSSSTNGNNVSNESSFAAARRQLDLSSNTNANTTGITDMNTTGNNLSLGNLSTSRVDDPNRTLATTPTPVTPFGSKILSTQDDARDLLKLAGVPESELNAFSGHSYNFKTQNSALQLENMMRNMLLKGGNKGSLRLANGGCDIASNGALIMPGANLDDFDTSGRQSNYIPFDSDEVERARAASLSPNAQTGNAYGYGSSTGQNEDATAGLAGMAKDSLPMEDGLPATGFDDGMDDDDDDGGPGFDFGGGSDDGEISPMREDYQGPDKVTGASLPPEGATATTQQPPPALPSDKKNPWAMLDPHNLAGVGKSRKMRKTNTSRLPTEYGLWEKPSMKVTGARTRHESEEFSKKKKISSRKERLKKQAEVAREKRLDRELQHQIWNTFHDVHSHVLYVGLNEDGNVIIEPPEMYTWGLNGDSVTLDEAQQTAKTHDDYFHRLLNPKKMLYGNEFAYIAKANAKRLALERKEARFKAAEEAAAKGLAPPPSRNIIGDIYDDDDDDDGYGGFDFGGGDEDDDNNDHFDDAFNAVGKLDDDDDSRIDENGNEIYNRFDDKLKNGKDGDLFLLDEETFENLCRAHVKAFAKGAEKYKVETNLTKRVDEWQAKLAPILEEEEKRPEFNIHVYGERILTAIHNDQESRRREKEQENVDDKNDLNDSDSNNISNDENDFQSRNIQDRQSKRSKLSPTDSKPSSKQDSDAKNDENVSQFSVVTENCDKYEVCRLFLSSLMLCNTGNILLKHDDHLDDDGNRVVDKDAGGVLSSKDSLKVELMHTNYEKPTDKFQQEE